MSMTEMRFARRMQDIKASDIRELLKVTEMPGVISFAGGMPAPELFPVGFLADMMARVIMEDGQKALQYSTTEGYAPLREKIAGRMNRNSGTALSADNILITSGSQQALDFLGKALIDEGDAVLCESPSYLGALNAFKAYGPELVEVPTDSSGMLPDDLEELLDRTPDAKFIYVVPDFQNPTGRTWSPERRMRLVKIASGHGVLVVEDNPYGELRFESETVPSVMSMDKEGLVVHLGTFSKILCPGMRIGWMAAPGHLIEKFALIKQGADLHTSTISQMQIDRMLEEFDLDAHVEKLRTVYRSRRDAMGDAMEAEFPEDVHFNRPCGGLFTWVELPAGMDARLLLAESMRMKVAFVPGESFFPCRPKKNTARFNYSNMPEDLIREGIRRLGSVIG